MDIAAYRFNKVVAHMQMLALVVAILEQQASF